MKTIEFTISFEVPEDLSLSTEALNTMLTEMEEVGNKRSLDLYDSDYEEY